jgi:hypothetical protein
MSRCRRTDAIVDIVADPALGIDALTDDHWQHVGICADCSVAVRNLERLDHALAASLRSQPHEELPPSVLATPALPRREPGPPLGPMLAIAAVVVLAVGVAIVGGDWLSFRGIGVTPATSPDPSAPMSTARATMSAATTTPAPSPSNEPTPTPAPTAETEPIGLRVGQVAAVVDEPLVVRTAPGTDPDSTITSDRLWIGQRVRILDGPADVDGYTWWEVQVGGIRGWVADAELDDSAPWLAPIAHGEIHFWRSPGEGEAGPVPELFSIAADGTGERSLGDPTAQAMRLVISCGVLAAPLAWTHDGSAATFEYSPGGCDREVFVMPADGSVVRKVGDGWGPVWRPDGKTLAFAPNPPYLAPPTEEPLEILESLLDHGSPQPLTDSDVPLIAGFPSWSPDRTSIAYSGGVPSADDQAIWDYRIYVADAETGEGRPIADGMRPTWSPDGRWVVHEVSRDDGIGTVEIWRVRPDGTDPALLGEGWMAAFSPDGSRLAVVRENGLWTMAPDGSDATLVIPATIIDGYAWSPNRDALVVASNHAGGDAVGISIVRLDLEAPAITGLVDQGHAPSWRPLIVERAPAD